MTLLFSTYNVCESEEHGVGLIETLELELKYSTVSIRLTKFYIQYNVFLHRQYLTWNPWTDPMS